MSPMSLNGGPFNVSIRNLPGEFTLLTGDTSSYQTPGAFGRFEVLHQIGAGVLGPVFLARDPDRARSVAIKVFRLDITAEQSAELASHLARLAHANLVHPSIVVPFDAGLDGTVAYLAEDYFAADSLDGAIRQYGPPPTGQAMRILSAVAGALDFAAAAGVQHGALHPRDLLVTPDDTHVTGFGIARALETIGLRAPMRRPYVAPERVQRESWDARADIYSLGALARELLVGRARPGHDAPAEAQLMEEQAAAVVSIVAKATSARAADRFATALELIAALQDALTRKPAGAGTKGRDAHDLLLPLEPDAPAAGGARGLPHGEDVGLPEVTAAAAAATVSADTPEGFRDLDLGDHVEPRVENDDEWVDLTELDHVTGEIAPLEPAEAGAPYAIGAEMAEVSAQPAADEGGAEGVDLAIDSDEVSIPEQPAIAREQDRRQFADDVMAPRVPAALQPTGRFEPERRSSALPMLLMLLVGLAIGAVAGYLVAARSVPARRAADAAPATVPSLPPAPVPSLPPATPASTIPASAAQAPAPTSGSARAAAGSPERLENAPANGVVYVRTAPRGAAVTIDGQPARGLTPLRVRNLAPGRHVVRVTRRGYTSEEREVVLSGARPAATVAFSLDRASRGESLGRTPEFYGSLSVDSLPSGARVFVDGRLVGTTPLGATRVAAGSHVVRVDRTGFLPWTSPIQVVSGKPLRVTASLERESR